MKRLLNLMAVVCVLLGISTMAQAKIVVIGNLQGPKKLSKSDVKKIYLGKSKNLPGGKKADPVNLKAGAASRDKFLSKIVGKNASKYQAYWARRVFTGKGKPPKEVGSESAVVNYVASHPGAIGFVDKSKVTSKVRVIYED